MNCPNCGEVLLMSERNGVEIDYCPKCRGVWLDKGELDKIIEKAAEHEMGGSPGYNQAPGYNPQQGYRDDYKKQYNHPRKKKGFLGDFFDFD